MRKVMKLTVCVVLIAILTVTLIACSPYKDFASENGENLLKDAIYTDNSGEEIKRLQGQTGIYIDIKLPVAVTLNTLTLIENGDNITDFKLYTVTEDGTPTLFYKQDLIGEYRYCAFESITATRLRIEIVSTKDGGKWRLKKIAGYNIQKKTPDNFRVMGYAVTGNNINYDEMDTEGLRALTQINMIGTLKVNSAGKLRFESEKDGNFYEDEASFAKELNNFRRATEGSGIKIIATILGKDDKDPTMSSGDVHTSAMSHEDDFIAEIQSIIDNYDLDGVALDYEYPHTMKENKVYGKFIEKLRAALPADKLITLAMSVWQFQIGAFPHKALEYVDQIELMAYDAFDENGFHSSFASGCMDIMNKLKAYNMTKYLSKINLGLPFYSRPTDGYAYWGDYSAYVKDLGKYDNLWKNHIDYDGKQMAYQYFNSYQLIYDKTTFAVDNNLGGVMIWHISSDTAYSDDLSLIGAIRDAMAARS